MDVQSSQVRWLAWVVLVYLENGLNLFDMKKCFDRAAALSKVWYI